MLNSIVSAVLFATVLSSEIQFPQPIEVEAIQLDPPCIEKPHLTLYYTPNCFYCQKVIKHLQKMHKTVPMKNIGNVSAKKELKKVGGKTQVPCLFINGVALYESDSIIQWLTQHQNCLDPA